MKRRYKIEYTDKYDTACPIFEWYCKAYNAEHAEELFFDSDDDGWKIVSGPTLVRSEA